MPPQQTYETQWVDHLGLVAGICREIGLAEEIEAQVGPVERKVSCGQAVLAMVLNLRPVHRQALRLLGPQVQQCYLIEG